VLKARENLKTLRRAAYTSGSADAHKTADEAALYLSTVYNTARREQIEATALAVENEWEGGRSRAAWKAIAELTGASKRSRVKATKEVLAEHFQTLLSTAAPDPESLTLPPSLMSHALHISTAPITLTELKMAMLNVPRFKAAGTDGIPTAAYTASIAPLLVDVMNGILEGGPPPPEWLESEIVPIFKKMPTK
jgi:hypothetical protein